MATGAAGWPLVARAQQPRLPVIGILSATVAGTSEEGLGAFRRGLREAGYVEGVSVAIESRWASGQYDKLPGLAAELAGRGVSLIFAEGNINAARAAKDATGKIPVVFANGGDPIRSGLVSSLNRPDGNLTGVSFFLSSLGAKRLEIMREVKPALAAVGFLVNPDNSVTGADVASMEDAARLVGLQLTVVEAARQDDFDPAFATLSNRHVGALLVNNDTVLQQPPRRTGSLGRALRHSRKLSLQIVCDSRRAGELRGRRA
jgi:putative ABC transport system substrate-binding protein